jgi:superfamily II DNA or RNA helicase
MKDKRIFTKKQRRAAYLLGNGRSMQSGKELGPHFHADHIVAYSQGGKTDMSNVQALTPNENLTKPKTLKLREWQKDALQKLAAHPSPYFSAEVVYGAGKTFFGIMAFLQQRTSQDLLIVIVPTLSIKNAWYKDAARLGVQLDPNWSGCGLSPDYHGIIITYQALHGLAPSFALLAKKHRLIVCLDECHHNGDNKATGKSIKEAFPSARIILNLSGTFFRHDDSIIHGGVIEQNAYNTDFEYTYTDALRDGIVRPCKFDLQEAFSLVRPSDGKEFKINGENAKQKGMGWLVGNESIIRGILSKTIQELNNKRTLKPDAAVLITCKDIAHAQQVAILWRELDGTDALVVTSDDNNAADKLESFKTGNQRCLISVKMVSEGVNIPRICVISMLSSCQTALFFRQLVGRGIRKQECDVPLLDCSVIAIDTEDNRKHAAEIEKQVKIGLEEHKEKTTRELAERNSQTYTVVSAGLVGQTTIVSGQTLEDSFAKQIYNISRQTNTSYCNAFAIIQAYQQSQQSGVPELISDAEQIKPRGTERKDISKLINKRINRLCKYTNETQRQAHNRFNDGIGVRGAKDPKLTLEKLMQKHMRIEHEIRILSGAQ